MPGLMPGFLGWQRRRRAHPRTSSRLSFGPCSGTECTAL